MREIKFRVWDKDTKEIFDLFGDYNSVWIASILRGEHPEIEVMQYTGLKDKNGKEIYEGDIVKEANFGSFYQVLWSDEYSEWNCQSLLPSKYELSIHTLGEVKVIGNIYENPELLEEQKK